MAILRSGLILLGVANTFLLVNLIRLNLDQILSSQASSYQSLIPNENVLRNDNNNATNNKTRTTVVVFLTNKRYSDALVSSVLSLRKDGGYKDDVAVLVMEEGNFTAASLKKKIPGDDKVTYFRTTDLWDDLLVGKGVVQSQSLLRYLRKIPPTSNCSAERRAKRRAAYYSKTLLFHPKIVDQWDTVLFLDSCMTFQSPHVREIFTMRELRGHILASPDPWVWGNQMIGGAMVPCVTAPVKKLVRDYVGRNLKEAGYFTTGFVLYDSAIVRNHGSSSSSTLLELAKLYHELSTAFDGDQLIFSIYWIYIRDLYQTIPSVVFGTPRVPYEYLKRMPSEPYIIVGGNLKRSVCTERATVFRERIVNKLIP